jgi:hypothetical protein
MLEVEIPDIMHLRILIRCIRTSLGLTDEQGVALYLPQDLNSLINSKLTVPLQKALNIRGRVKDVRVAMKVIDGCSQAEVDKFVSLRIAVLDTASDNIATLSMEVKGDSLVSDILSDISAKPCVPEGTSLRMVLVSNASIVRIVNPDERIDAVVGGADSADRGAFELRAEFVPEDQKDLGEAILLKCSFSRNFKMPSRGCILTPFFVKVESDETFGLTKCKIASLIHFDLGELTYRLYRGSVDGARWVEVDDGVYTQEAACAPDAVLYLLIRPEILYLLAQRSLMQQDLKIYN